MHLVHHERRPKAFLRALFLWLLVALVLQCSSALALNPNRRLTQYAHGIWRMQDGVLGGTPSVITQTADGYLWIGTNLELVRFDGIRFLPWIPPPGKRLLDLRIFSLLGARDGSLWIGTGYSISQWSNGELINYPQLSGRIESIVEDDNGIIWLARTQITDGMGPLCSVQAGQLRCYGATEAVPFKLVTQLAKGDAGHLWIGGYSALCLWGPGASETYLEKIADKLPGFALLKPIATAKDGSVWTALDGFQAPLRLEHISQGTRNTQSFPEIRVDTADIMSLFVDRENALWIGTAHHGMFRAQGASVEHFDRSDGLSANAVGRFFQDAEGTMWIVTAGGIDNLRDLHVATFSMREGMSGAGASAVLASRDGSVWVVNFDTIDIVRGIKVTSMRTGQGLPGRHVTTLFEDHAGLLWMGIDGGLWTYDGRRFRALLRADGGQLGTVFAITEDTDHNVWVRAGPNLDRIQGFTLQEQRTSAQIATAYTLAANPQGGLVMGLVNGDLVRFNSGTAQTVPANETGNTRQIRDLLVEADGSVWGTTLDELVRWKDGIRRNLTPKNGLPCDGVFALTAGAAGSLWLDTRCGLVHLDRSELNRWWKNPESVIKPSLQIDESEGMQPGLTSLKPQLTSSSDGRLWMVNGATLQMLDPSHENLNTVPPPVHIEEIIADRQVYSERIGLKLPALTRDLVINYTALSFVSTQRVGFRYKLEGRDTSWQEPGTRRLAFYGDLPPGRYRFRVIASNNDGLWNTAGADLEFAVAPAIVQTVWFKLCLGVFLAAMIFAIYLLRMRQVTEQLQMRVGERLIERERIARELHDTLLQGFQGLVLRFQAVMKQLPVEGPARQMMEQSLDRADEVLLEGRQRVRDLRSESPTRDELADALKNCMAESAHESKAAVTLTILGASKPLDSIVCDELYRIGREALINAFRHAEATKIEVELTYDRARLRLVIRDNGIGMDQAVLNEGRSGHWGIWGMKERAEKIGCKLNIWSECSSGTEVDLKVSGHLAYMPKPHRWQ